MQDLFKSKLFWITALVAATVVFVVGINIQKTYIGETELLFLPKSEKSAADFERIIGNAEKIPLSFSFYDKFVKKYDTEDEVAGLPNNQRKEFWNSKIKINRIGKTGIIHLEIAGSNQLDAEILSKQIARELITVMSDYYDIKKDLDMRIVEGSIVSLKNKLFNIGFFLLSLTIGLVGGIILYFLSRLNRSSKACLPAGRLGYSKFQSQAFPELSKELENKAEKEIVAQPIHKKEQPASVARKAFAPENLPVGSDFTLSAPRCPEETTAKQIKESEKEKELKTHEASEEEIKRRLNKLLGGQM